MAFGINKLIVLLKRIIYPKEKQLFTRGKVFYSNSIIDVLTPEQIEIGENFISAPGSIILSHDASLSLLYGYYRIEKTIIGNNVFLGANAVILPGIKIDDNVIIGAGSIVTKNIPKGVVVAGNPAKIICSVDEYFNKCKARNVLYKLDSENYNKLLSGTEFDLTFFNQFKDCLNQTYKVENNK